jgi:CheY-like chemotaxis protein
VASGPVDTSASPQPLTTEVQSTVLTLQGVQHLARFRSGYPAGPGASRRSLSRSCLRVAPCDLVARGAGSDDDPGDVALTTEAFEFCQAHGALHVVGEGEQAIQFLRRSGPFTRAPRPGLILLDVNLPRRNGLEVLAEVKADDAQCSIPLVMVTTSQADDDILRSYALHANACVSKPMDYERFSDAITRINDFFLSLAHLPR